ncbi:MAG: hypothetical protein ACE5OP_04630 [Candidatus Glassbacteria bacterium]
MKNAGETLLEVRNVSNIFDLLVLFDRYYVHSEPLSDEVYSSKNLLPIKKRRLAMRRVYNVPEILASGKEVYIRIDVHKESFHMTAIAGGEKF